MDAKLAVKTIMAKTGTSQERLAMISGMKGQSNITGILNRGTSLRVDKLDQMIRAMGYKLVIVPGKERIKNGWYIVESGGDDTDGE